MAPLHAEASWRSYWPFSLFFDRPAKTVKRSTQETPAQRFNRVCAPLIKSQGELSKAPDPTVARVLELVSDVIALTARKYGVPPEAIAGAILAENTLNMGIKDELQTWLAKTGRAPTGEVLGYKFTYGIGQLRFERAITVEQLAAQYNKRPARTNEEVNQAILSIEGSIDYIGALIRQADMIYKAHGYDISSDVGALVTLYNIGDVESRAQRTAETNSKPQPNNFGCYVEKNMDFVRSIVAGPVVPQRQNKVQWAGAGDAIQTPVSVDAFNIPSDCTKDRKAAQSTFSLKKSSQAVIVSAPIRCQGSAWLLVLDQNQQLGWVPWREDYQKGSLKLTPICGPEGSCLTAREIPGARGHSWKTDPARPALVSMQPSRASAIAADDLALRLRRVSGILGREAAKWPQSKYYLRVVQALSSTLNGWASLPSASVAAMGLLDTMEENIRQKSPFFDAWKERLDDASSLLENLNLVASISDLGRAMDGTLTKASTKAKPCIDLFDPASETLSRVSVAMDQGKRDLRDESTRDLYYSSILRRIQVIFATFGDPMGNRLKATKVQGPLELVNSLKSLGCVDKVLVPRSWLVTDKKVVFDPGVADGKAAVLLSNKCGGRSAR